MNSESKLVVELWDYIRDLIGSSKRADTALQILRLFEEYGFDLSDLDIQGECEYLDEAIFLLVEDDPDSEDPYDDNED